MTNEQFYAIVLKRARRPGDPTLLGVVQDGVRQMLQALEMSPFHPWFLETESAGLQTVADQNYITMPTDFLLFVEDTRVELIDEEGNGHRVERWYLEAMRDHWGNAEGEVSRTYDLFADRMYLAPTPDAVYDVNFQYYAKTIAPEVDLAEVDNLWALNAEDFTVTSLARRLVEFYVKDEKRARALANEAVMLRSELHKYNEARKHSDHDYRITD